MKKYLGALAILALLCSSHPAQAEETKADFFQQLQLPKDKIPKSCKAEEVPQDSPLGKDMTNPGVTTDLALIKNATQEDDISLCQVKAMYFGVYKAGSSEAGTFAWQFDSEANAKQTYDKLLAKHAKDSDTMKIWLKDLNVVMVWHDPGASTPCYKAFKSHVEKILGK